MAVNPKVVMAVVEATRNEKIRNFILTVVLFALGLVIFICTMYSGMLSGVFCIVQNITLRADWSHYSKSISSVFDDLRSELGDELRKEVYDFMPDFSAALSKALITQSLDENVMFTEDEIDLESGNTRYTYSIESVVVDDCRAKKQTLCVSDGRETKSVEYICVGGEIYLPEFLAMYNVHQTQKYLLEANESNTSEVEEKIEEIVGNAPETEEEFAEYMKEVWNNTIEGTGKANVGLFKTAALKAIIKEANIDGAATLEIDRDDDELTITLQTISSDTWKEVFEIDESLWDYVEQEKMTIELALNAAQVPEEERTISLDGIVQTSLFEYFGGMFEMPVKSERLTDVLEFGSPSPLHVKDNTPTVNEGMTLILSQKSSVEHLLSDNCDSFVESSFVYDVWNMNEMEIEDRSRLYNQGAVTFAYVINVKKFKDTFGFQFPDIDGVVDDSGYITLLIEYSCLDNNRLKTSDIGGEVKWDIGSSHDGTADGFTGSYQHSSDCSAHIGLKVAACSGKLEKQTKEKVEDKNYDGLSDGINGAVMVNPRLWFKGLTVNESELPEGVFAAMPQ